ncbi:MAG: hypothetical protein A3B68_02525 [Candidatus Melainabacteria bacterium RIFCSPHIGHO2_02_FULL_34_12]|nr:MAG: hypothetical protein A3B68_02525 [Candidatus Melainabacteria bacterium RIFCSPHIGHO2_02_FULL_34_12]
MSEHIENTTAHTEAHHHAPTAWDIFVNSNLLNIIILALAFIYLGNKFMPKIIDQRKKQISKELDEAKNTRIKATKELEEIKKKVENAEKEIQAIKEEAKNTAGTIKKQTEDETEAELEQLHIKVKKEINAKQDEAIQEIKRSAAQTAIKLAEDSLNQIVKNKEIGNKLMENFIAELGAPSKN